MALLGNWIDKGALQTIGGGAAANFFQTCAQQVGTIGFGGPTIPDTGICVVRSVQAGSVPGQPYWFGANASIATLGLAAGSIGAASVGLVTVDCFNIYFHSIVR